MKVGWLKVIAGSRHAAHVSCLRKWRARTMSVPALATKACQWQDRYNAFSGICRLLFQQLQPHRIGLLLLGRQNGGELLHRRSRSGLRVVMQLCATPARLANALICRPNCTVKVIGVHGRNRSH